MVKETLSGIEKQILMAISGKDIVTVPDLISLTELSEVEVMRGVQWLDSKGLIEVNEDRIEFVRVLNPTFVFPERDVLRKISESPKAVTELDKFGVQWILKRKWGKICGGKLTIEGNGKKMLGKNSPDEDLFMKLNKGEVATAELAEAEKKALDVLRKRPKLIEVSQKAEREIKITEEGQNIVDDGLDTGKETNQLTHDLIVSGKWADTKFRKYDLGAPVPQAYPGKKHPLTMFIDKIRRIFLEMGFEEREGPLVEAAFWNFDALFQPQDHPARDMADTFYLSTPAELPVPKKHVPKVRQMHEKGDHESLGWGYKWEEVEAGKAILRTHTTAVSARSLPTVTPPAKVFSIGRIFRNETIDYKHLAEFHQVDGIVVDPKVTFRDLLGYLKEFYLKMGFEKIRFRPGYFPYTEMSVEPEVYFEDRGEWIELGGSGIFRPEVTRPLGIDCPVLAWGLGVERMMMLTLDIDDLRTIYGNDLAWLRSVRQVY